MIKIGKNYLAFFYFWVENRFKRYYRDGFLACSLLKGRQMKLFTSTIASLFNKDNKLSISNRELFIPFLKNTLDSRNGKKPHIYS